MPTPCNLLSGVYQTGLKKRRDDTAATLLFYSQFNDIFLIFFSKEQRGTAVRLSFNSITTIA
jgi:hypothetical protein